MNHLFTPLKIGHLTLENRVVIAPMCQYSADEGAATDWHTLHLGRLALSGAGLLILEAAAVNPTGRITYADLGLWDDRTELALAQSLAVARRYSNIPIAIQLSHAGRKASTQKPWDGGNFIAADAQNGWPPVAPSALPFTVDGPIPDELSVKDIVNILEDFTAAAKRAERLGIDAIEIHAAHGYLIHQFLSPLSNTRDDQYGGNLENRMRFLLDVVDRMLAVISDKMTLGVRISATDWVDGGWDLGQSIILAQALAAKGCHFIHVSTAGLSSQQQIPVAPGFQVPFAEAIKQAVDIPVIAVGLIDNPKVADEIIASGKADAVALARGILYNPHWVWHAAAELGQQVTAPPQYLRSSPHGIPSPFK
ncbi:MULTISPECIES: NADH:flavin oxidoreductase/NADH oxidase [Shewanella]|jgi:2,4-dienoyl-CoA reductase-like NADH-dependent reductase (Old Yellow Enzyme family)|uniref:NADH:flavin oxidoreductase/NADH oxidase n=1 Tax=Shewanella algicola TaxID=640633 RepID=A0A9X2CCA4_9GAMM|nr:NADH:flavin oxidoreductase/NADH oxidase [Shewanella algicola]MCL1107634.1 NADH:flavin oxidoreductase/NADH oxidase [Shewanella algicola]GGP71002.1 oxidoreductase [Shewanella algicola]|tara:strand:- start:3818 stop:4912 length:1095 start_codon:yes stop_codon:yes gene_type:complete